MSAAERSETVPSADFQDSKIDYASIANGFDGIQLITKFDPRQIRKENVSNSAQEDNTSKKKARGANAICDTAQGRVQSLTTLILKKGTTTVSSQDILNSSESASDSPLLAINGWTQALQNVNAQFVKKTVSEKFNESLSLSTTLRTGGICIEMRYNNPPSTAMGVSSSGNRKGVTRHLFRFVKIFNGKPIFSHIVLPLHLSYSQHLKVWILTQHRPDAQNIILMPTLNKMEQKKALKAMVVVGRPKQGTQNASHKKATLAATPCGKSPVTPLGTKSKWKIYNKNKWMTIDVFITAMRLPEKYCSPMLTGMDGGSTDKGLLQGKIRRCSLRIYNAYGHTINFLWLSAHDAFHSFNHTPS